MKKVVYKLLLSLLVVAPSFAMDMQSPMSLGFKAELVCAPGKGASDFGTCLSCFVRRNDGGVPVEVMWAAGAGQALKRYAYDYFVKRFVSPRIHYRLFDWATDHPKSALFLAGLGAAGVGLSIFAWKYYIPAGKAHRAHNKRKDDIKKGFGAAGDAAGAAFDATANRVQEVREQLLADAVGQRGGARQLNEAVRLMLVDDAAREEAAIRRLQEQDAELLRDLQSNLRAVADGTTQLAEGSQTEAGKLIAAIETILATYQAMTNASLVKAAGRLRAQDTRHDDDWRRAMGE